MGRIRRHLTFANVVSCLALFAALGGVSYAALKLPKNSVGSKQIKANAVRSSKVKDHSLKAVDFAAGQIPAGPPGANGADGTAAAFARVQGDGTLLPLVDQSRPVEDKVVAQSMVTHPATGKYCIDLPFAPSSAMVSLDNAGTADALGTAFVTSVAIERGNMINPCTGTDARILITKVSNTATANTPELADHGFFIWFEK